MILKKENFLSDNFLIRRFGAFVEQYRSHQQTLLRCTPEKSLITLQKIWKI